MTLGLFGNCILQCFVIKIVTAQMPAAKYIMGQMGPMRPNVPTMPSVPMPYPTNPTVASILNTYLPNYPNIPGLPSIPNAPALAQPVHPLIPIPSQTQIPQRSYFDPTVMNNLAIALHLLILTNLLHPSDEAVKPNFAADISASQSPVTYPNPQPTPTYPSPPNLIQGYYSSEPQESSPSPSLTPPNSKFLSSSGFVEPPMPSLMGAMPGYGANPNPNARNSYSLMSPYEALGPGPQGKDVFAQYGPQNLKADFQSPYNSIMANDNSSKDLFNMF